MFVKFSLFIIIIIIIIIFFLKVWKFHVVVHIDKLTTGSFGIFAEQMIKRFSTGWEREEFSQFQDGWVW